MLKSESNLSQFYQGVQHQLHYPHILKGFNEKAIQQSTNLPQFF